MVAFGADQPDAQGRAAIAGAPRLHRRRDEAAEAVADPAAREIDGALGIEAPQGEPRSDVPHRETLDGDARRPGGVPQRLGEAGRQDGGVQRHDHIRAGGVAQHRFDRGRGPDIAARRSLEPQEPARHQHARSRHMLHRVGMEGGVEAGRQVGETGPALLGHDRREGAVEGRRRRVVGDEDQGHPAAPVSAAPG